MEYIVLGLAVAFNLVVIKIKFEKGRIPDGSFDAATLILLTIVGAGTYGGLVITTIASCLISVYLLISPPKIFSSKLKWFTTELRERLKRE